jgi:adenylate kinase
MPPSRPWICDVCGGKVVQRDDDTEEAISRRLELYDKETVPVLDYYRDRARLAVVDGVGTGDDVFERIVGVVDDFRSSVTGRKA